MRVGLKMDGRAGGLEGTPPSVASNLSELEVTLGRLAEAVADGRRAIDFADRSGDAFRKMVNRTTAADALHQAGERAEAGALFAEAERMQAERQPRVRRCSIRCKASGTATGSWPPPSGPRGGACWRRRSAPAAPRSRRRREGGLRTRPPSTPAPRPKSGRRRRSNGHDLRSRPPLHRPRSPHAGPRRALPRPGGPPGRAASVATRWGRRSPPPSTALRQANSAPPPSQGPAHRRAVPRDAAAPIRSSPPACWPRRSRSPSGARCRCTWPTSTCTAPASSATGPRSPRPRLIERHGYGRRHDELADAEAAAARW